MLTIMPEAFIIGGAPHGSRCPIHWCGRKRLKYVTSAWILEHATPDWTAIAYDLGYSSQQHFITNFKREPGKTPLQYKSEPEARQQ
jgi:AraC-like DNA-binding protein